MKRNNVIDLSPLPCYYEGLNGGRGGGEGEGGSTCRLSVKISLLCCLSVIIFDLCRLSVNPS